MASTMSSEAERGHYQSSLWDANCKDCRAEQAVRRRSKSRAAAKSRGRDTIDPTFQYTDEWASRLLHRGDSLSDRCERHRKAHRLAIQALSVPYVTLDVIGEVLDHKHPTGPLGGLGPLPRPHRQQEIEVNLADFEFGMSDQDILELLDGLSEKRVAVVEAGTGTGKSTFMPFRLMRPPPEARLKLGRHGPIVVTEPRRAAAKGVARFVGEDLCLGHDNRTCDRHFGPGFAVGYQVSGEKNWDGACELVYVTDGTMINWIRDGQLARIGAVIVDEAHERSENIDVILAQLRYGLAQHRHLRVIITSATLDRDFFIEYFGGTSEVFHMSVPPKKSFGYGVPLFVGLEIEDELIRSGLCIQGAEADSSIQFEGWQPAGPDEAPDPPEDLWRTTRELAALRCVSEVPLDEWRSSMPAILASQIVEIAHGTEWGDVLGFLPTTAAIQEAISDIGEGLAQRGLADQFDVYPLLATTDRATSEKATAARSKGDKRKIVVSSNLAETSLTVKGVRYVVDSGLICQPEWDPELASGSYPTVPHSQSGVRQRWGRVGRDAPGWVFPLYTVEQFQSLPRTTPPGAAQVNLEGFYLKLLAAGMEGQSDSLPAGFRHPNVSYDSDALRIMETFDRESQRAREALRRSGAVDEAGLLTEYGRDLERFSGGGAESLALMLAEQLACAHEVALTYQVLGQGRLVGTRGGEILGIDKRWPGAWRVQAIRRYRALAAGCRDDLDLLLRVFHLWQTAADPSAWCRTWWVSEAALLAAWAEAMDMVATLSAAMKGEATRTVRPELGERVRGVLTRSFTSLRYDRTSGGDFRSVDTPGDDTSTVLLSHTRLTEPGDRIMAFNRFRVRRTRPAPDLVFISHAVNIVAWAEAPSGAGDDLGFDLLCRSAWTQSQNAPPGDTLQTLRDRLPIDTVLNLKVEEPLSRASRVLSLEVLRASPPAPMERTQRGTTEEGASSSGFDRDWDPTPQAAGGEMPDEELDLQLLDPRLDEVHDEVTGPDVVDLSPSVAPATDGAVDPASLPLRATAAWDCTPLRESLEARVVAYATPEAENDWIDLVVEPLDTDTGGDGLTHPDLAAGHELEVQLCGMVADFDKSWAQFTRTDGGGYFFVDADTPGLSWYDTTCLSRLKPGAILRGVVIPDSGFPTLSILPSLASLLTSGSHGVADPGDSATFYEATVIETASPQGWVSVELASGDRELGMTFQFSVHQNDVRAVIPGDIQVGLPLHVSLEWDRRTGQQSLKRRFRTPELKDFVETHSEHLALTDRGIELRHSGCPFRLFSELERIHDSGEWRNLVWSLYKSRWHLSVKSVRVGFESVTVQCPEALVSLLVERKADWEEKLGVIIRPDRSDGSVTLGDPYKDRVDTAAAEIRAVAALPRFWAGLPPDSAGRVIGKGQSHRLRLEGQPGIRWVWVEDDHVGVIGDNVDAVRRAIRSIREVAESARGEFTSPPSKIGLLIGPKGSGIKALQDATGCRAWNPDRGARFVVEGPSRAAVEHFIRLASQRVGGGGRVLEAKELRVFEEPMGSPTSKRQQRAVAGSGSKSDSAGPSDGCFIATACYGDPEHHDVATFRQWRDGRLSRHWVGRRAVALYYWVSPGIARSLSRRRKIASVVRAIALEPIARWLRWWLK